MQDIFTNFYKIVKINLIKLRKQNTKKMGIAKYLLLW